MRTWVDRSRGVIAAVTTVLVLAPSVLGCGDGGGEDGGADTAAPDGAAIYADRCAGCHGVDGGGGVGPALADDATVTSLGNRAAIEAVIARGRSSMPAFAGSLTPEEISEVATYISGF